MNDQETKRVKTEARCELDEKLMKNEKVIEAITMNGKVNLERELNESINGLINNLKLSVQAQTGKLDQLITLDNHKQFKIDEIAVKLIGEHINNFANKLINVAKASAMMRFEEVIDEMDVNQAALKASEKLKIDIEASLNAW